LNGGSFECIPLNAMVLRDDGEEGGLTRAPQEHQHIFFLSAVFCSTLPTDYFGSQTAHI